MRGRARFRTLVVVAVAVSLILVASWVGASNMGFKLNYGIVHAVNTLLHGSGVSFSANVQDNVLAEYLDLAPQPLPAPNSNMGFKLNLHIVSLPTDGIEVDAYGTTYLLSVKQRADGSSFLSLE